MMAEQWRAEPYTPVKGEPVEIWISCIQNVQDACRAGDDHAERTRAVQPVAELPIAFEMLNFAQTGDYGR